ncbi:MFS transporter [Microbacterium hominis]|uniref:MFS transporter n=1 Tax=Microbacterium TaxID=33882 RepID=UPI00168B6FC8|nr:MULTISPECIES: MFS transporter [Microbacterium]QOC26739.1 MFS transporter [Microbacterium hominis]QOC27915.1 MFS transporter [Microbacterium hominis]QYF96933.1 MFS transporter [Microbacterium sp. PAMC21962]
MTETIAPVPRRAWVMLALGVAAQAAGTLLVSAPAYLIPQLHSVGGMSLAQAGLLAAAPTFGMVCTLVLWGLLADRRGERGVIAGGLALTGVFALACVFAQGYGTLGILLVLGGAASASTNAASGRVVIGWFPKHRRGLAMGIRQMSQPLGVAAAALVVPPLAESRGLTAPFAVAGLVALALAALCAWGIRNPPRPAPGPARDAAANPYRRDGFLLRIHLASALLVVPQFALSTFGLVWLISGLGWEAVAAGAVVAGAQFVGAVGRIGVGHLSDRLGTRVGLLRGVAVAGVVAMALLALAGWVHADALAAALYVVASTIAVADNGLAYTSVAEAAGASWSGRALGVQNTGQFLAASAVAPAVGALIALVGYPAAFAIAGSAPLMAFVAIPRRDVG